MDKNTFKKKKGLFSDLCDKNKAYTDWINKEKEDQLIKKKNSVSKSMSVPATKKLNIPYYKLMIQNKTPQKKESKVLTNAREIINVERLYKIKNYLTEAGIKL